MSRRPRHAVVGLVAAAMAVMVLTGCHTAPRLGVPTTVYPVGGHCDTSAVVEVGASLPLSGFESAAGRAQLLGLELGVTGVNAAGGVLTSHRCLELLYKDDRSDPAVDNQALLDLVNQEKVSFLEGPFLALETPANLDRIGALGTAAASYSALGVTVKPREFPDTFPVASSMADQASVLVAAAKRSSTLDLRCPRSLQLGGGRRRGLPHFQERRPRSAGLTVTARTSSSSILGQRRRRHGPTSSQSTRTHWWSSTADRPWPRCSRPAETLARHCPFSRRRRELRCFRLRP